MVNYLPKIQHLSLAIAIGSLLGLFPAKKSEAISFTPIADTDGIFQTFFNNARPGINDSGTVAFTANLDSGGGGIFTGSGGLATPIVESNDGFSLFTTAPSINNNGRVAFQANKIGDGFGIFSSSGGSVTTIADSSFGFFGDAPDINDDGTVIFLANSFSVPGNGIYSGSGGPINTIANATNNFTGIGTPSINNDGIATFIAGMAGRTGVFTESDGSTNQIATGNNFADIFQSPDINNNGTVSFVTDLVSGIDGVFKSSDGSLTAIADTSDPRFNTFFNFAAAINDSETVAFQAGLNPTDPLATGIFVASDPLGIIKVIETGDQLAGTTVTSLSFSSRGLNNSNQIAFAAQLDNGTSGIYRANLGQVPEASPLIDFDDHPINFNFPSVNNVQLNNQPTDVLLENGFRLEDWSYTITAEDTNPLMFMWDANRMFNLSQTANIEVGIFGNTSITLDGNTPSEFEFFNQGFIDNINDPAVEFLATPTLQNGVPLSISWLENGIEANVSQGDHLLGIKSGFSWTPNAVGDKITISSVYGVATGSFTPQNPTSVPETTSTFGFLALGTLGIASSKRRKPKPSKSTEKEVEKVS